MIYISISIYYHLRTYSIIHRDLKPSNIFLTSHDSIKAHARIADFNRARSLNNCVN